MYNAQFISLSNQRYPQIQDTLVQVKSNNLHTIVLNLKKTSNELPIEIVSELSLYYKDLLSNYFKLLIDSYIFEITTEQLIINFYIDFLEDIDAETKVSIVLHGILNESTKLTQTVVEVLVKKSTIQNFNLAVVKEPTVNISPNFLIEKSKQNVPSWSKAFQQTKSNFTKTLEPSFNILSNYYQVISKYLEDTSEESVLLKVSERPIKIIDSSSNQYLDYHNIHNSNYKDMTLHNNPQQLDLISCFYTPSAYFKVVDFLDPCKLYLRKEIKQGSAIVYIEGIGKDSQHIVEVILLTDTILKSTINTFTKITKITSEVALTISNYIDCIKDHFYLKDYLFPVPIFVNKENNFLYYTPSFKLERNAENTLPILSIYDKANIQYKFSFSTTKVDSLYIDKHLNVYWAAEGLLHSGNLGLNFTKTPDNITTNANKYIFTTDEVLVGDWIDLEIDLPSLYTDLNIDSAVIKLEHNNNTKYLDPISESFVLEKTRIYPNNFRDKLKLSLNITDSKPITFSIITETNVYVCHLEANMIMSNSAINISEETNLVIYNDMLKVARQDLNNIDYDFNFNNKTLVGITWEHGSNLDYDIKISESNINNTTSTISSQYFKRLFLDENTNLELLTLDIANISKDFFQNSDVVLKIKANWHSLSNQLETQQAILHCVNKDNIRTSFLLTPKDTSEFEYEIRIDITTNEITGILNANY